MNQHKKILFLYMTALTLFTACKKDNGLQSKDLLIYFKGEFAMTPSGKIDRLKTTSNP